MASTSQEPLTPKQQALHDLEYARASMAYHASHAAEDWSPRAIITRSVEKHRALWIGGAAVAGLLLLKALWPSRHTIYTHAGPVTSAKRSGWSALLLGPLIALARKYAVSYGTQMLQTYMRHKVSPNGPDAGAV